MRIILFLLFAVTSIVSWGQLFSNPITGTNPNASNPYTIGQTVAPNITVSGIGRGAGATGTNANNRYNANSWNTATIDLSAYFEFTLTPNVGCQINFTNFIYTAQASGTGATSFAFRSSLDGFTANIGAPTAVGTTINLSGPSFQNLSSAITFRLYGWDASASGGTFSINDFTFNGSTSCGAPVTITTGAITGSPFAVDCSTSDNGSVAFTSSGTFNIGNTFTVQLSNASGSFASPISLQSLSGAGAEGLNPSGTINFDIPAGTLTGAGYLIRIVSSDPFTIGSSSSAFNVTLSGGPCVLIPPHLTSVIINSCDGLCTEGNNEIVFGSSGDYSFNVNTTNFDFLYGTSSPGTNYTDVLVNNATRINELNIAAGCGSLFVDATGGNIPVNSSWMLASTAICEEALTWSGLCGSGPIYVIFQNDVNWQSSGNFANNPSAPGIRYYRTSITTTLGSTFTIDYTTDGSYPNSDGVYATFDSNGGPATLYGDNDCILQPTLLPTGLLSYSGEILHGKSSLYWQTSSEQNNDYFTISHSTNGYDFEVIGQLQGAGNSSLINDYNLIHNRPSQGINYYKLMSTDYDGTNYTKGIISLLYNSDGSYYDAQKGEIKFNERSDYRVISMDGKIIGEVTNETSMIFYQQGIIIIQNLRTGLTERLFIP